MTISPQREADLTPIVEQRLTALFLDLQNAGWETAHIAATIKQVMNNRWHSESEDLAEARAATPSNFISDGNEG